MYLGHPLRLCCWCTCVDNSLRCALALRNRSDIEYRSYITFASACVSIASVVFVAVPIGVAALGAFLASFPPSSPLPLAHSSAPYPRYHVPAPFGPFLPAPVPVLYPFHTIGHTSSYDVLLLASGSLCVVLASFPTSVGAGPSFSHHFVDDDVHLFHNFVELPRSRQELSLDVLRHQIPSQQTSSVLHQSL